MIICSNIFIYLPDIVFGGASSAKEWTDIDCDALPAAVHSAERPSSQ